MTFALAIIQGILILTLSACSSAPQTLEGPSGEIRALTGARVRVAWVEGDGTDPFAAGDQLVLMGLDTDDGRGERVILGERQSYVKPLLTPGGDRIIFSTRPTRPEGPEVFIVGWDGAGLRRLSKGFALSVWRDPADGREWVYVGTDNAGVEEYDFRAVSRFRIDEPGAPQVVWNKSPVSSDTFQVSADGRVASGLFPWPKAGFAELPNGALHSLGEGCWTALADVGVPLAWYFDGSHRNLTIVNIGTGKRWTVGINDAPGLHGAEVYHPRWSNHARFLAISGPYNQGGVNQVRSGGAQAEVYLGRFSADFSRVEAWVRVTHNASGDSYPDVWIDRDRSAYPVGTGGPPGPGASADRRRGAPGSEDGGAESGRLVVEARLASAGPIPTPRAILPYRNALVVNDYDIIGIVSGAYAEGKILVAQWAIRDGAVLATANKTGGEAYRLTLERYDDHPELEGERLIAASDAPDLPIYYEVGS